jgi:hypothetical protein
VGVTRSFCFGVLVGLRPHSRVYPQSSGEDPGRLVQLQAMHRGSSDGGAPFDKSEGSGPSKVVFPSLPAGMEERNLFPGFRIGPREVITFGRIAVETAQRKIVQAIAAAFGSRDDMLEMKGVGANILRSPAVFTLPRGSPFDSLPKGQAATFFRD